MLRVSCMLCLENQSRKLLSVKHGIRPVGLVALQLPVLDLVGIS